jgi:ribosomal-protein-alanine N-acetyltransferase
VLGLNFIGLPHQSPELEAEGVRLRAATLGDGPAWLALREQSRAHLTQWEPDWLPQDATLQSYKGRMRMQARERRAGAALPLLIFRQSDGALVGGVTLANIRYHASCSAGIGYWIGAPFLRQGYALAAIAAVVDHAFNRMGLNRVEAACQPENEPSRSLLGRVGFREEGLARKYLFINGAWRDHCLFAAISSDWRHGERESAEKIDEMLRPTV